MVATRGGGRDPRGGLLFPRPSRVVVDRGAAAQRGCCRRLAGTTVAGGHGALRPPWSRWRPRSPPAGPRGDRRGVVGAVAVALRTEPSGPPRRGLSRPAQPPEISAARRDAADAEGRWRARDMRSSLTWAMPRSAIRLCRAWAGQKRVSMVDESAQRLFGHGVAAGRRGSARRHLRTGERVTERPDQFMRVGRAVRLVISRRSPRMPGGRAVVA